MQIGRFTDFAELGRGGMAIVYVAEDPVIKRRVAIKVLPRQLTLEKAFRDRFTREVEVIAGLEYPAVVPIFDYGEHLDQPYIVMRYMAGGSLADLLNSGPVSIQRAFRILHQIAQAMDYAHARSIIHRDIKPSNILFDDLGNAYLSDFGIAKMLEGTALTTTGLIGTPAYMSPEQYQAELELDGRADVYSLGVILYEMLSGEKPYKADTPARLMKMHLLDPIPEIPGFATDLPAGINQVIASAMCKDREDRYKDAASLSRALEQLIETSSLGITRKIEPMQPLEIEETVVEVEPRAQELLTDQPTRFDRLPETATDWKSIFPRRLNTVGIGLFLIALVAGIAYLLQGLMRGAATEDQDSSLTLTLPASSSQMLVPAHLETVNVTGEATPTSSLIVMASPTRKATIKPAYPSIPGCEKPSYYLYEDLSNYLGSEICVYGSVEESTLHEDFGFTIYEQGIWIESWNRWSVIFVSTNQFTGLDFDEKCTVMKGTIVEIPGSGGLSADRMGLSIFNPDYVYPCP